MIVKRLFFGIVMFSQLVGASHGVLLRSTNQYELAPGATLEKEAWLAVRETALIHGEVQDDLYLYANYADLAGIFGGDLWVAAPTILFSGTAHEQVRLVARSIKLSGTTHKSVMAVGGTVESTDTCTFLGDAYIVAESASLRGNTKTLYVMARNITIHGRVEGNLNVVGQDIVILPGTEIHGNLRYSAPEELVLDSRVIVHGSIRRVTPEPSSWTPSRPKLAETMALNFYLYTSGLISGIVFMLFFPNVTGQAVRALRYSPGVCLFAGIVGLALVPMAAILLAITVVGFPLAMLLILGYVFGLYCAKFPVALLLGGALVHLRGRASFTAATGALIIGLFLLYAGARIPYVGPVISLAIVLWGFGALVSSLIGKGELVVASVPPPLPHESDRKAISNQEG